MEIRDSYPLQAAVIILATWNAGRFRFMINDPHSLVDLKNALKNCEHIFEELKDEEFRTANFDDLKESVETAYSILSRVEAVKYTGAFKIFHLFCPKLIVMLG